MRKRFLTALLALASLLSCSRDVMPLMSERNGTVTIGFQAGTGDSGTRTTASGDDRLETSWEQTDEVAVWAIDSKGGYALSKQVFRAYGKDGRKGWFTSEIDSPMPDGKYRYHVTYPVPEQVNGNYATFNIPEIQGAKAEGGSDILVGVPAEYGPMTAIDNDFLIHDGLSVKMKHMTHRLRFFTTEGSAFGGEAVQKVVATFSRDVVGSVTADISDPGKGLTISGGGKVLTIEADEPVKPSTNSVRDYLCASIMPVTFAEGDILSIKAYSETKVVTMMDIPLDGRSMQAGHSTPVRMSAAKVANRCKIYLKIDSNNLGEPIETATLTAPEGCKWGDNIGNTYVWSGNLEPGAELILEYEDESAFRTLSDKTVSVTYDSEHVTISEEIRIGNLDGMYNTALSLNVPYLLYEDFSGVGSISSDDRYTSGFSIGSKKGVSFLNGWSGARVGAMAGTSIRIACRRETSADYPARVDSAPLRGMLKKDADISVEYDYGADNEYDGIPLFTLDGNVGQTVHTGYVTSTKVFESGDNDGHFESGNSLYIKEYTGTYTNLPGNRTYVLHNVPGQSTIRISWRSVIEHQAGATNTTAWFYLDNIKVRINKK